MNPALFACQSVRRDAHDLQAPALESNEQLILVLSASAREHV